MVAAAGVEEEAEVAAAGVEAAEAEEVEAVAGVEEAEAAAEEVVLGWGLAWALGLALHLPHP